MPKVYLRDVVVRIKDKVDKSNTNLEYYIGGEHFDYGDVCITKKGLIAGSTIGPAFHMRFKPGDVLLMSRNPHLRKAGVVDFEGICSDVSYVCRTRDEKTLLQAYLPFIFQTDAFWEFAEENKHGSTNFFLNWSDFEKYQFELPTIEEQKNRTELLWAAQNVKGAYQELLRKTDELVKSQFIEMIEFSDSLNNLGDFVERCTPKRCAERSLPVLSVTKERSIVFQESRFESTVASVDKSNYIIVPRGHIVQGIHIDEGNFGLQSLVDEGIVSPAYKLWRIKNVDVVPEVLEFYLRSDKAIDYYTRNFQGTTVARRQTIKTETLLNMPLNLPSRDKQLKFYSLMKQTDKSKFEIKKAIENVSNLIKSLMSQDLTN